VRKEAPPDHRVVEDVCQVLGSGAREPYFGFGSAQLFAISVGHVFAYVIAFY